MLTFGMSLPDATFLVVGDEGMAEVHLRTRLQGRRVVIFAVPGAFTPTCDASHMPSFVRSADALRTKGVDDILCISVNDPHVMRHWSRATGAADAGITVLADAGAEFTKAIGMAYSMPERGMLNRSRRYSLYAVDGVVQVFNLEESNGSCGVSAGETLLEQI
jgi:glutaredoxin/glutathione-dependent peroxiredoxin